MEAVTAEEYEKLKGTPLTPDEVRNAWASGVSADKMDTFMSRVLATAEAVDELRAENKSLSTPCPTCGSSLFDCADCAMGLVRILRAERDELKEALEDRRSRGDT